MSMHIIAAIYCVQKNNLMVDIYYRFKHIDIVGWLLIYKRLVHVLRERDMHSSIKTIWTAFKLGTLMAVLLAGCQDDNTSKNFEEAIRASKDVSMPREIQGEQVLESTTTAAELDNSYGGTSSSKAPDWNSVELASDFSMGKCTIKRVRQAPGYDELFLLDSTNGIIYPGAILDGSSFENGSYRAIGGGTRKPIDISVSILGVRNAATTITDPNKLSQARLAINRLLRAEDVYDTHPTGKYTYSFSQIYSEKQLELSTAIHFRSDFFARVRGNSYLNYDNNSTLTRIAGRFQHRYYTVDVDIPGGPADMYIAPPAISPAVTPVYVSSVTYGRSAMITTLYQESLEDFRYNFNLDIQTLTGGGSGNLNVDNLRIQNNASTYVTVAGGRSSTVTNITSFYNFVRDSNITYSDGVPLAYTLRSLKDNSVVRTVLAGEFVVRECRPISNSNARVLRTRINEIRGSSSDEPSGGSDAEFYGRVSISPTALVATSYSNCTIDENNILFERGPANPLTGINSGGVAISESTSGFHTLNLMLDVSEHPRVLVCTEVTELDGTDSDVLTENKGQVYELNSANFGNGSATVNKIVDLAGSSANHWFRLQLGSRLLKF